MNDHDQIHCITFHTPACDDHQDRLVNLKGLEGLDDVCPICEIDRLRALLLKIRQSRLSKLDAWEWLMFEIDEALRDE